MRASHTGPLTAAHWMDSGQALQKNLGMDLTREEAQRAAQACRVAAVRAEVDANRQSSLTVRQIFENDARAYAALAAKLTRMG